ncbi:vanillate monooxygenase [Pseudonocardia sulfidoxydans NBRC 16205]|uniref:Vanillate monooxygenase n=1 Tax=Pseudonocardia sulfidoxydans NBRC 16205 TaxID=1223511 RepID=A0A511D8Y1_9PSEU|nr:aromatic ring-hydroxylating dioxygenase subunit alpha [Pseudonocardia sulfidoxydans]GEL21241.1 vanillate monooxygenase [Pseudonocardia sulfidoxydans NBRC 16205]
MEKYGVAASRYPTQFPRNQWYVAGLARDFGRVLQQRWLLDEPVCFYRREDGTPVALADRCIHRQMPLTLGRLKGDDVECGYHGILFAADGRARKVPSQKHVPDRCRVRAYPVVESGGLLWIWMGDADRADAASIPGHPWLDSPQWRVVGGTLHMNCRAQLLNENLLDLSHVSYLHPDSIGTDDVAEADVETEIEDRRVRVTRDMHDVMAPPAFEKVLGLSGRVDRKQVAEYFPPGFHVSHLDVKPAGATDESATFRHKAIHCITPERGKSAHYFWLLTRQYRIDDDEIDHLWLQAIPRVLEQDIVASEAIEEVLAAYEPEYPPEINIKVDAGPLAARRIIARMVAEESAEER